MNFNFDLILQDIWYLWPIRISHKFISIVCFSRLIKLWQNKKWNIWCDADRSVNFKINLWRHCFSQNTNQILQGFLPCSMTQYRAEILAIFSSKFGRNTGLEKQWLHKFILKFTDLFSLSAETKDHYFFQCCNKHLALLILSGLNTSY